MERGRSSPALQAALAQRPFASCARRASLSPAERAAPSALTPTSSCHSTSPTGLALGRVPFWESTEEDEAHVLHTNVDGLLRMTRLCLPHIADCGHIVCLGS